MKLLVACVGKLKRGPELQLVQRYEKRLAGSGKAQGITGIRTTELPESRAGDAATRKLQEADAIRAALGDATPFLTFDERGKPLDSRAFAKLIGDAADNGTSQLGLVIGGPDGLDESLRQDAHRIISFG
ncbi:MAG: 23S rRNA (pseudouridine(1915)-N(3))-methyltransferase RlmH, partial [Pseudomonadota bacterium]